jgi:hypothetical protein
MLNLLSKVKEAPNMADDQPERTQEPDLAEGYPDLDKVLRAISNDPELPKRGIRRIEVNTFASGDATYQVYVTGADEGVGGYLPPDAS